MREDKTVCHRIAACLCLLWVTSAAAQQCPDISKLKLPTTEGGKLDFGATTFQGEIQVWNRPNKVHWIVVRGCGGGAGGGGASSTGIIYPGGRGGEGVEPRVYLLGPLTSESYLIVAGIGGKGAAAQAVKLAANSGQNGCPSEIYELGLKEGRSTLGPRLLSWQGGRGGEGGNARAQPIPQPSTPYADSGSAGTPGYRPMPGGGGGGGLGTGGKGGSGSDDAEHGGGAVGGLCAGGGGGSGSEGRRMFWAGGDGGPGVITLIPITDIASILSPSDPEPPSTSDTKQ